MSTDRPRYEHVDEVESLEVYEVGGYHPVHIGDCLNKYTIIHKLGHGSYSTTWLARHESRPGYAAVKIGTATSTQKEANVLETLAKSLPGQPKPGKTLIPALIDRFEVRGPNGSHPCLVTRPAMCSLADAVEAGDHRPFQTDVARSLAAQLAMAVAYMHSLGYVHGDLHYGNLLLQLPAEVNDLTHEQLYETYDSPDPEPVLREDGKDLTPNAPSHVYAPIWMGLPNNEISIENARLTLNDFGTAYRPDVDKRLVSFTPLEIRPPEARFEPTEGLGFPSDIWSLGCMIWALLGVDALGPMPDEWWQKWESKTKTQSFTENGVPKPGRDVWTFERRFEDSNQKPRKEEGMEVLGDDERRALFDLIRSMLRFRPGDRMSASQVLEAE
ncbi:kinase domain-containing protein [Plectosphaerella cucumerina]|uniref:Kinase domain-containing protein n=1 Tax=Plectosphaerella cucumerina TaxID=40658 RepID=A0A8K0TPX5_9PEZI|nr:kinase domain-containing protein [Plectosphaerella cucumerina]